MLETTPFEVGDYMYGEVYTEGTLIVHPYYPCPHCGVYHEYTDQQIKLRDEKYKSPMMIRRYKSEAVYYECPHCLQEITERDRAIVDDAVIWAAPEINREDFQQDAEIIKPDRTMIRKIGKTLCLRNILTFSNMYFTPNAASNPNPRYDITANLAGAWNIVPPGR